MIIFIVFSGYILQYINCLAIRSYLNRAHCRMCSVKAGCRGLVEFQWTSWQLCLYFTLQHINKSMFCGLAAAVNEWIYPHTKGDSLTSPSPFLASFVPELTKIFSFLIKKESKRNRFKKPKREMLVLSRMIFTKSLKICPICIHVCVLIRKCGVSHGKLKFQKYGNKEMARYVSVIDKLWWP